MARLTNFFTVLMRKYLPDPFVFAIGLTLLAVLLAVLVEGQNIVATAADWGKGFWNLLAFTTQVAVMLAMGYVLARAPIVDRLLDRLVNLVHTPRTAIIAATLVGAIGSYLNWAFGLVIGGIVATKLASKVKGVHYPLIIAAAYSGFSLYGMGLSSSVPVLVSTPGHPLEKAMGVVPLSDTIFAWPMVITTVVTIVTLPLLNAWLHPKKKEEVIEYKLEASAQREVAAGAELALQQESVTLATKLNNSRILSLLIGLLGFTYIIYHFATGGSLDFNIINFIILFGGILLLGTPANYVTQLNEGIKTVSGILLQYPFYAGIMAIMAGSGLVDTISAIFVKLSDASTLPLWGLWSSYIINFFAPSGGGHWVVQGPFMIEAAKQLGAPFNQVSMSVMLGNAWNDLIQPFWILPVLAISNLKLKDIMGYLVIMMLWVGVIFSAGVLLWGYLG
ncbi:short-chain fatty acid transporter [Brevibacillus nitrificans]|uniref:Short-chain fatty acid transporter n=1 Tax=Brevibacillus nitrificans TaxID=651560 RepID=A0A3M8DPH6_9BACL|nr:TIGR00366 family protein [Brevibacillus nitrificans]RNB88907.1 short-chain fatty acid transporter [Brevibacillus nitrificans]